MKKITSYRDYLKSFNLKWKIRQPFRNMAVRILSLSSNIDCSKNWIRFPYYHHIFDDERKGFERHLDFFGNYGDFVSVDDALSILKDRAKINGRYFCITFDDGYKNHIQNAFPILDDRKIPVCFFIPVDFIGLSITEDNARCVDFQPNNVAIEFMTWNDCQYLADNAMIIGSHGMSHKAPVKMEINKFKEELVQSKSVIEEKLSVKCNHYCGPFGRANIDFDPNIHPLAVKEAGYLSFHTNTRGSMNRISNPFHIERDLCIAWQGEHELKYFFSL